MRVCELQAESRSPRWKDIHTHSNENDRHCNALCSKEQQAVVRHQNKEPYSVISVRPLIIYTF